MARPIAQRIYDVYARFYDGFEFVFKRCMATGLADARFRPGSLVLDVGVGTGLSLPYYASGVRVVGIDLSAGMLREAAKKAAGDSQKNIGAAVELIQTDALCLPFADGAFDGLVMSHVISTVPNPALALREAIRVCRNGARIVLVNHFRSEWPVLGMLEKAVDPLCRKLGWRSDLSVAELLQEVGVHGAVECGPGLFQIVHLQKQGATARVITPPEGRAEALL